MPPAVQTAPTLVFGWGNPSRGDDALGPLFCERIEALRLPGVECLTDFQLQVEHALDLAGRRRVLFVDAALAGAQPQEPAALAAGFHAHTITPARDASFTTHTMSPQSVLQVYRQVLGSDPPPAWLLAIHGIGFELGDGLSAAAAANLDRALAWAEHWLRENGATNAPFQV
ncbi:MAG: hydrogenase maturation protease [Rhodocyclaceae bacterium]|nr:hydrogenase maturation protease [Rhodocyclaceae bacterium]